MKTVLNVFTQPFPHKQKMRLFRRLLYVFLFLNTLTLLPIAEDLFGYYGIIGSRGWNTSVSFVGQGLTAWLNLLSHPLNAGYWWLSYLFIAGQLTALGLGFFNILPRLANFFIYFFSANLFFKGYSAFTGGEVLVLLLLFYLIFIDEDAKPTIASDSRVSTFQNVLNNTFYWVMLIQVCTVYVFSTWYKLYDENWLNGQALNYISQIDHFSSGMMRFLFENNPVVSAIAVYATLLYQLLFPILVWIKKIKLPFLFVGVILHLGIAFGMGLFTFGITMILMYILFLSNAQLNWLQQKIKGKQFKA